MPNTVATIRNSAYHAQHGLCFYCGQPMWNKATHPTPHIKGLTAKQARLLECTAEHLNARQDGGGNSRSNIVAACRYCNQHRHLVKHPPSPEAHKQRVQNRLARGRWHGIRVAAKGH